MTNSLGLGVSPMGRASSRAEVMQPGHSCADQEASRSFMARTCDVFVRSLCGAQLWLDEWQVNTASWYQRLIDLVLTLRLLDCHAQLLFLRSAGVVVLECTRLFTPPACRSHLP